MRAMCGAAVLAAVAGCLFGCAQGDAPTGAAREAIIGGTPDTGDPAVVMLVSYPADHSTFDTCTASVIAKDVLLTAAHCLDPATHLGYSFGVFTGPDASGYPSANTLIPQLAMAKEAMMHPDYNPKAPFTADIGVVLLGEALGIEPLPFAREPLDASIEGKAARIVGYGQKKYQEYNAVRYEATTVVAAVDPGDTITVGDLQHRSCVGDSGGPALVDVGGVETIVGVDSYTDLAGCLEPAHYRRPDLYTAFLDKVVPPSGNGGSGGGGSGGMGGAAGQAGMGGSAGQGGMGGSGGEGGSAGGGGGAKSGGCHVPAGEGAPGTGGLVAALGLVGAALRRRKAR